MMFIITDKNPRRAVKYFVENVPKKIWTKQLRELGHLISSCGISDVFKRVPQGKEIQEWIKKNVHWVYMYYKTLYEYCVNDSGYKYKDKSKSNFLKILKDIERECLGIYIDGWEPVTGIFRYQKSYTKSKYSSNIEIPIDECTEEYKKYLKWKVGSKI